MSFFYDLNKKLDSIRATPEVTHKQLNERDEGKPGKNFEKIAKDAGERYGSKAAGERVAGAVRNKLRDQGKLEEEGMSRAAKGYEKYGKEGMEALARAGREGKALDPVRAKYDKYDNTEVDEGTHTQHAMDLNPDFAKTGRKPGVMARVAQGAKKVADFVAPGDEELINRLKKPREPNYMEAARYRDPRYKDQLYTQEPLDHTFGPDMDAAYYNNYPDDYEGRKRKIGGSEFSHNDPLRKGFGRGGASNSINTRGPRKGLPSRDQITSLKGSIKDAHGTHARPNLPEDGLPMVKGPNGKMVPAFAADGRGKNDLKKTFADKIAGAKKEVDEMLGDVAAEAMKSALGQGKQPVRGMGEATKEITGGRIHTAEPGGYGRKDDEDEKGKKVVAQTQRGRGRPKKNADSDTGQVMKPDFSAFGVTGKDIKLPKHKGIVTKHKMVGENNLDPEDQGEYDQEGDMAKDTIKTVVRHAQALEKILGDNDNLPEWVQAKLAKIESMMTAVDDYMQNQADDMDMDDDQEPIAEKAVSKKQQRFMGMVHATQKGEKAPSREVAKVAKSMGKKDAEDFASTKQKGLPEKAAKKTKEKDVEESTTSGSVATSGAAPKAAKGSGGFTFGKGIYDSLNREVEGMIAESMSINMSMNNDANGPTRSLTVTATDDDATKLAQLLKSAGLGGAAQETCSACGSANCDCDAVDESYGDNSVAQNSPDYPTNTETAQDNFEYSGGLNKPKSTGQTTVPVIASQEERQYTAEGQGPSDAERLDHYHDLKASGMDPDAAEEEAFGTDDWYNDMNEQDPIARMMEMAGVKKKAVEEEKTEEGNKFTGNLAKARAAGKKEADLDGDGDMEKVRESIFTLTNQWKAYKG